MGVPSRRCLCPFAVARHSSKHSSVLTRASRLVVVSVLLRGVLLSGGSMVSRHQDPSLSKLTATGLSPRPGLLGAQRQGHRPVPVCVHVCTCTRVSLCLSACAGHPRLTRVLPVQHQQGSPEPSCFGFLPLSFFFFFLSSFIYYLLLE